MSTRRRNEYRSIGSDGICRRASRHYLVTRCRIIREAAKYYASPARCASAGLIEMAALSRVAGGDSVMPGAAARMADEILIKIEQMLSLGP